MNGSVLAVLMVLATAGTMLFVWLGAWCDAWRDAKHRRAYRDHWLRTWHTHRRSTPEASLQSYIREHKGDRPIEPPIRKQFLLEKLLFAVAAAFFVVAVLLFNHAFYVWGHGDSRWAWFTAISVVVLLVWCVLVMAEAVLPGYARNGYAYVHPVLPIEEDGRTR